MYQSRHYPPAEERFNIWSHGFGCLLSIVGTVLLLMKASQFDDYRFIVSSSVYGFSLIILYAASTLFHGTKDQVLRNRLNIFDHAAIFVLIAGTYTPFTLITLEGQTGWILFGTVWSIAILGVIFKLFFTGKYTRLSMFMYVLMGWLILFAINPLMENLSEQGLIWLMSGGIFYSIGAVFFSWHSLKFNHGIFHIFVLLGSFCHFVSIYQYVLSVN